MPVSAVFMRAAPVIVTGTRGCVVDPAIPRGFGAQLLFQFAFQFAAAHERRSLGVASHWPFGSWGRFLPEYTTAMALLDRLPHHSVVVVTSGDSH